MGTLSTDMISSAMDTENSLTKKLRLWPTKKLTTLFGVNRKPADWRKKLLKLPMNKGKRMSLFKPEMPNWPQLEVTSKREERESRRRNPVSLNKRRKSKKRLIGLPSNKKLNYWSVRRSEKRTLK